MNNSVQSIYNWYRNTIRNPQYRWWIILGTLAYIFSPFDISPDLFPILGQIDDVAITILLISEVSQLLVDFAKSRQSPGSTQVDDDSTSGPTVDVEAVSVDENDFEGNKIL